MASVTGKVTYMKTKPLPRLATVGTPPNSFSWTPDDADWALLLAAMGGGKDVKVSYTDDTPPVVNGLETA